MEIEFSKLSNINDVNLIDIRDHYLYERSHFPNAINISYRLLRLMPFKYLTKDKVYYLICETGYNSLRLSSFLNSQGYNTFSIKNGYLG